MVFKYQHGSLTHAGSRFHVLCEAGATWVSNTLLRTNLAVLGTAVTLPDFSVALTATPQQK